jgi:Mg2+ and Co2+ transporter CorA
MLTSQVFGIHPLTTEDILLEETREKIELFRNYYLVCFRSFDQDPYSQTYLEPLNMYIIVFREGTLSVSPCLLVRSSFDQACPLVLYRLTPARHEM